MSQSQSGTYLGYKIADDEVNARRISKLSNRPNAVSAHGGQGLSAEGLKDAFDEHLIFVQGKFNALIDELEKREGANSAEARRKIAEIAREEAEHGRVDNENARLQNEDARVEAEEKRETAEASRKLAESARAEAETARQVNFMKSEENRQITFEGSEAFRQDSFNAAVADMWAKFEASEADRENAYKNIDEAADRILEIQNSLINGEGE